MKFTKRNKSQKKRTYPTLRSLQFVDSKNREHYLFRLTNSGSMVSDVPFVDLKQINPGKMLTASGMIFRATLENRELHMWRTAPIPEK